MWPASSPAGATGARPDPVWADERYSPFSTAKVAEWPRSHSNKRAIIGRGYG